MVVVVVVVDVLVGERREDGKDIIGAGAKPQWQILKSTFLKKDI